MLISTNQRVITVGKMMVRTLVIVVGWPAAAWIRPTVMPATAATDPAGQGAGRAPGVLA
jgi:hypothetical protein